MYWVYKSTHKHTRKLTYYLLFIVGFMTTTEAIWSVIRGEC
jgi:hypothetical protein